MDANSPEQPKPVKRKAGERFEGYAWKTWGVGALLVVSSWLYPPLALLGWFGFALTVVGAMFYMMARVQQSGRL